MISFFLNKTQQNLSRMPDNKEAVEKLQAVVLSFIIRTVLEIWVRFRSSCCLPQFSNDLSDKSVSVFISLYRLFGVGCLSIFNILSCFWSRVQIFIYFLTCGRGTTKRSLELFYESSLEKVRYSKCQEEFNYCSSTSPMQKHFITVHQMKLCSSSKKRKLDVTSNPASAKDSDRIGGFVEELLALSSRKDAESTEDQIKTSGDSTRPILIIKGTTMYQESYSCFVVVEKTILLETDSVLQGAFFIVLSHYVYGMLLDINPQKGNKCQQKKKHQKLDDDDSRAIKLINKIVKFETSNIL
ncbi:uncharacterized protein LOC117169110 [Belonocnema kinseyi]|uniref:uncharacterized protein LOC117169110 n=1 Tax=Belonocnema kinseyi TaxID=2817044 RepID=UPI00143DF010|nr:uncharacterized protein LOC117169110 [Belonocnema kinseyi]